MFFIFLPELILTLITVGITLIAYYSYAFRYWKKRNVPTLPTKFLTGNLENPFTSKKNQGFYFKKFYEDFKKQGVKYGGVYMFASPLFVPIDLDLIKNILTKDYTYFNSRGMYQHEAQPISENLFFMNGEAWKNMRGKLSPTFTSGKMKMMFNIVLEASKNLTKEISKYKIVDIKNVTLCYGSDSIGSCAFGIECNSFNGEETDFIKYSKKVVNLTNLKAYKDMFTFALPNLARKLNIMPFENSVNNFFTELTREVMEFREKNGVTRNDFMQILLDMKNKKNINEDILKTWGGDFTFEMMVAQSFVFFIAGFETSSSTLAFILYELGRHKDIQEKCRKEINEVLKKHNGQYTYEAIMEMKYSNQIVEETLRLYPIVSMLTRRCTQDYQIPGTKVIIEKGTNVAIAPLGIHMDPEYYPEPEKFDPDRFTDENKAKRLPYTYLPFGEGPRLCIGMRFGIMQIKLAMAQLLPKFEFSVNSKTKEPLVYKSSPLLTTEGGIWLNVKKL